MYLLLFIIPHMICSYNFSIVSIFNDLSFLMYSSIDIYSLNKFYIDLFHYLRITLSFMICRTN